MSPIMRMGRWSGVLLVLVGCGRNLPVDTEPDASLDDAGAFVCTAPSVDRSGGALPSWAIGIFNYRPPGQNPAFNLRVSGHGDFVWESGAYPAGLCDTYGGEHGVARVVDGGVGLFPALDGGDTIFWSDSSGDVVDVPTVTLTPDDGGLDVASDIGTLSYVPGTDCGCGYVSACECDPFPYYAEN